MTPPNKPTPALPLVDIIEQDLWSGLRSWTDARIALGRCGNSLCTRDVLTFQLDHAKAKDAVHQALDSTATFGKIPYTQLHSQAVSRNEYLQRPDLGRLLTPESEAKLKALTTTGYDISFSVSAGLSSTAIAQNFQPFWKTLAAPLAALNLSVGPLCYIEHGRVAIADHVAQTLKARMAIILIGERPGLSSPDSMGIYLTYAPSVGTTDEARNCISNIRPAGQSYEEATRTLCALISGAFHRGVSGVNLKVDTALKELLEIR